MKLEREGYVYILAILVKQKDKGKEEEEKEKNMGLVPGYRFQERANFERCSLCSLTRGD